VLVQTFSPDHPAIQAAVRHDYQAFAANELPTRREHHYPPFTAMIRIVVRGPAEQTAEAFADEVGAMLRDAVGDHGLEARVLGPAPAPIAKLRGMYRFQLQLQSADADTLRAVVKEVQEKMKPVDEIQWIVDVDPLEMM
jgi:primosomal protein N' (replication factor Y)